MAASDGTRGGCISADKVHARSRALGLVSQVRRAAVAIPANIAEGQGRRTCGEFLNHLSIAHGSVRELETHVMLAGRLGFIPRESVKTMLSAAAEVGRLVTGLANSLER